MPEEQNIDKFVGTLRKMQKEREEEIEENLKNELGSANEEYEAELQEIDKKLMEQVDSLMNNHSDELGENIDHFQQLLIELKGAAYHWDDEFWQKFSPGTVDVPAECHRVGTLKINGHFNQLETLALVPIINGQNVVFLSSEESNVHITQAFQSLILRLIVTSPKGKIRLFPIEPLTKKDSILGLFPSQQRENLSIEDDLDELAQYLLSVKKKHLTDDRSTLVEAMTEIGYYPVPHYILAITDFPHTFSETAIRQLMKIMQQGPACGIHTIMVVDSEEVPDLDLEGLDEQASVISYQKDRFVFSSGTMQSNSGDNVFDYSNFDLELDQLPDINLLEKLIEKTDISVFDSINWDS